MSLTEFVSKRRDAGRIRLQNTAYRSLIKMGVGALFVSSNYSRPTLTVQLYRENTQSKYQALVFIHSDRKFIGIEQINTFFKLMTCDIGFTRLLIAVRKILFSLWRKLLRIATYINMIRQLGNANVILLCVGSVFDNGVASRSFCIRPSFLIDC